MINRAKNTNRGYTLLFAVLTSALVLGIAVFIVTTTAKQYELAAAARNSMYSFYAADTGLECVAFAYSQGLVDISSPVSISCNGGAPQVSNWSPSGVIQGLPLTSNINRTASMNFGLGNGTCASITVYDGNIGADHFTYMDSRGYNKCDGSNGPDAVSPNTVERALRLGKKG